MKFETMELPESIEEDSLIATYYMSLDIGSDIYEWVRLVASDQSVGTWTHVEGETPEVIKKHGAKVIGIYPMQDGNSCIARIAFPTSNFPAYTPMIMSTIAGNILGQNGIRLVDIEFPESIINELPGPILGIEGIRELLNITERPLVGAILKPCIGVTPEVSAEGVVKAALGGADVIKDDELLSDTECSPMVKRVKAVMSRLREIGKDKTTLYAVNITGENLNKRAIEAIEAGANSIMVNYQALGWGATEDLVRFLNREKVRVPIFGHCAGAGAYYRSKNNGISTSLCCGKLARIIGMDMSLVYPDTGRFGISTNELIETHSALISQMSSIKRSFTTVAGGVHPGTVEYLINLLGNDTILMAGGGIYGHPMGAQAGAKALLQAIQAIMEGVAVSEAAKNYQELDVALKFWSV